MRARRRSQTAHDASQSTGGGTAVVHERFPWEFRGVVRLTRIGTIYLIATVVLAIAAINTGNNSIYIAVAFMLGCLLLSGIASKGGLKHLSVEIAEVPEAWAGRRASGVIRLRNSSRIWNVRDVVLTADSLAAPVLVPIIRRRDAVTLHVEFIFPRRGRAQVTAIESYTRYPFGFFLKKRRLATSSELIVYPRILPDDGGEARFRRIAGQEQSSSRRGAGSDIHSFREYSRGDSLRHVHWKKSASLGRWIIKQTATDVQTFVHVVIDPWKPHSVDDEAFEEMVSSAATFIYHAVRRGDDVMLTMPRLTVSSRTGESAAPLFRALALVEPARERVHQVVDRGVVLFTVAGGRDDAKSA